MDEDIRFLHEAAWKGDVSGVQRMLQKGVSPDASLRKTSPLSMAVRGSGSLEVARVLLEAGCHVNSADAQMQTPLFTATKKIDLPLVQLLVSYGADVSLKYLSGDLPIHEAVKQGSKEIFLELMKAGSDLNATNNGGDTLLHMSAARGMHTIVQILLDAGCDVDVVKREGPKPVSNTGFTPLHFAANIGHAMVCDVLLKGGADINARTNNQRTPLHLAAMSQRGKRVMDTLISHGCDLNALSMEQEENKTPLLKAVDFHQSWAVQKLVEAGADINATDHYGCTGLLSAIYHGYVDIVRIFIQAGCDVNLTSKNGQSPFTASLRYPPYMSKMLMMAGCVISEQNRTSILNSSSTTWKFFSDDNLEEDIHWIIYAIDNPRSLLEGSRLFIRKIIGDNPYTVIQKLPLPERLRSYLQLPELHLLESRHLTYVSQDTQNPDR